MFDTVRTKVLQKEQLKHFRRQYSDQRIVFCTGCYDILQTGHAVFFNQCKEHGDILVVGIGRDQIIKQLKGAGRPVNYEINRLYLVAALQDVDYAVLNDQEIIDGKIDFKGILDELRPDVFVINDDDSGIENKEKHCQSLGIRLEKVSRVVPEELEPTSTTHIIDKINFAFKAPLRIDFAGGWTDINTIMNGQKGYVSNMAIKPHIEYKTGQFNFSGYPRGSGLSTSTAVQLLYMISAKTYNSDSRSLAQISEDLFHLENKELNWMIGRQDQYSLVYGGFHCFEFGADYARDYISSVSYEYLDQLKQRLLLLHTSVSRNAQSIVEEVYHNAQTSKGQEALNQLAQLGVEFAQKLQNGDLDACAKIMHTNFQMQKQLAASSSTEQIDRLYDFALQNGAIGGKICGAGGGGAMLLYAHHPNKLLKRIKQQFNDVFEIEFDFEYKNIKDLNKI